MKRYMMIVCRICRASHENDRACHVCGARMIEDAKGQVHVGRIRSDGTWIDMARAGSIRDSIMRAARKIGYRTTFHLN